MKKKISINDVVSKIIIKKPKAKPKPKPRPKKPRQPRKPRPKMSYNVKNQHAKKKEEDKITGHNPYLLHLGDLRPRIDARLPKGVSIAKWIRDAIEMRLQSHQED